MTNDIHACISSFRARACVSGLKPHSHAVVARGLNSQASQRYNSRELARLLCVVNSSVSGTKISQ